MKSNKKIDKFLTDAEECIKNLKWLEQCCLNENYETIEVFLHARDDNFFHLLKAVFRQHKVTFVALWTFPAGNFYTRRFASALDQFIFDVPCNYVIDLSSRYEVPRDLVAKTIYNTSYKKLRHGIPDRP